MNRAVIFTGVLLALILILLGVQNTFEANVQLTGANGITRPMQYQVFSDKVEVSFLGEELVLNLPIKEPERYFAVIKEQGGEACRWTLEKIKQLSIEAQDFCQQTLSL